MRATTTQKTLVSALTAMAGGLVITAAPAPAAQPPADCLQFGFPGGGETIKISSGNQVIFSPPRGQSFLGVPSEVQPVALHGTMSGSVDGRSITLTNTTNRGPFVYTGTVGADGIARGDMSGGTWYIQYRLTCLERPAPPVPAPAPVPVPVPPPAPAPDPAPAQRADTDKDGLFDDDETNVYGTNPAVADTDGDGPDDGQEVFDGTDPLDPNSP